MISDGTEFVYAAYTITLAVLVVYTGRLLWKVAKRQGEVAALEPPPVRMEESHV